MARKLSASELHDSSMKAQVGRLFGSLQYPLSPEGERVLAAAKVGLQLIRNVQKKPERKAVAARDSRVIEENFPDSIRELLALHRQEIKKKNPVQALRPDHT